MPLRVLYALSLCLLVACRGGPPTDEPPTDNDPDPPSACDDCTGDEVCVLADLDATAVSCVDPRPDWYDDGTDPEKHFEDAGDGWFRKRVDDWEAADLRCNDGSPYAYYVNPGAGDAADKWLVYFKGGGACFDVESCGARWLMTPQFMKQQRSVSANWVPTRSNAGAANGIFARDQADNAFADWTQVWLHYCSSDSFVGSATRAETENGISMRGWEIAGAAIGELVAGLDPALTGTPLPALRDATDVLVYGGSAGANGARLNMDRVASAVLEVNPTAVVRGFGDSAVAPQIIPGMFSQDSVDPPMWNSAGNGDADCLESHPAATFLCADQVHLISGGGLADHFGGADGGHLGVPGSGEFGSIESLFTFIAQWDPKPRLRANVMNLCVQNDACSGNGDCGGGTCFEGNCYEPGACVPELCMPGDEPCWGLDDAPACLFGQLAHPSQCDGTDDCGGDACLDGFCVQDAYMPCGSSEACGAGEVCDRGVCTRAEPDAAECDAAAGYTYDAEARTCSLEPGCGDNRPCDGDHACQTFVLTPRGQTMAWAIREALSGGEPRLAAMVADSTTHTAASSDKYYGPNATLRVDGRSLADALAEWYADPAAFQSLIAVPPPPGN